MSWKTPADDAAATISVLRGIIGSAIELMIEFDADLRVVHASRRARATLGIAGSGAGAKLVDWLHPDDRDEWTRHFSTALGEPFHEVAEAARLRVDPQGYGSFGLRFRSYLLPSGGRRALLLGTRRAEREGRSDPFAARVFLTRLFEDCPAAAVFHDASARILYANPAFCSILGYSERELADRTLTDILEPGEATRFRQATMPVLLGDTDRAEVEVDVRTHGGEQRTIVFSGSPFELPTGSVAMLSLVLDRTEYRRAKEELIRKEKQASIGALSAGIAHEVSNPVASILAAAQYGLACKDDIDAKTAMVEALEAIAEESKRCGRIIRGVLKLAKSEPGRREPIHVRHLLERARDMTAEYAAQRGVTVEIHAPTEPFEVDVCLLEIETALDNVVRNAIEASRSGDKIEIATHRTATHAVLSVRDCGRGIAPADLSRAIEPFFTTRGESGGTGLGLSIANAAISANGGELRLESNPSGGTTAQILLALEA